MRYDKYLLGENAEKRKGIKGWKKLMPKSGIKSGTVLRNEENKIRPPKWFM